MIAVEEALRLVEQRASLGTVITIPTSEALGFTLAETAISKINMPPFRQSAMDGYAVSILEGSTAYTLIGEVKAGDSHSYDLKSGEAVRIFTGAAVPDSADAVIMQEKVNRLSDSNIILEEIPFSNQNIRPLGEQCLQGQEVLFPQTHLNPAALSYLISLGIGEVKVYRKPKVAIVVTGSELISINTPYSTGKIYESNSILLKSELNQLGIDEVTILKVEDNYQATEAVLKTALQNHDVVLVSGGISVGDYDFVGKALRALGTEEIFYKIKQKPGKPLFFGKNKDSFVYGLPGNPASALTCFYMYVQPLLKKFMGSKEIHLKRRKLPLSHDYTVKGIRAQFLKAYVDSNDMSVSVMNQQSSAMIAAFIEANAYIFFPEYSTEIKEGALVEVIPL